MQCSNCIVTHIFLQETSIIMYGNICACVRRGICDYLLALELESQAILNSIVHDKEQQKIQFNDIQKARVNLTNLSKQTNEKIFLLMYFYTELFQLINLVCINSMLWPFSSILFILVCERKKAFINPRDFSQTSNFPTFFFFFFTLSTLKGLLQL